VVERHAPGRLLDAHDLGELEADALHHAVRAGDRREHQHVVAHAEAAVATTVAEQRGHRRPASDSCADSQSSNRLATLWACTCSPAAMSALARPIAWPYLTTASPAAIGASATLWPSGTGVRTAITLPSASTRSPAPSSSSALATLSRGSTASTRRGEACAAAVRAAAADSSESMCGLSSRPGSPAKGP